MQPQVSTARNTPWDALARTSTTEQPDDPTLAIYRAGYDACLVDLADAIGGGVNPPPPPPPPSFCGGGRLAARTSGTPVLGTSLAGRSPGDLHHRRTRASRGLRQPAPLRTR